VVWPVVVASVFFLFLNFNEEKLKLKNRIADKPSIVPFSPVLPSKARAPAEIKKL